jgi:hypothetical protein
MLIGLGIFLQSECRGENNKRDFPKCGLLFVVIYGTLRLERFGQEVPLTEKA